ncbi:MAG: ABC transporter permease [Bacteroidaceae bacterium]|nr:ABC transporter permease [Bacteroidaceae bacterium]
MLLKRYTTSSLLNILGMAVAFAAVYIIMVQVNYDLSYNKAIPNAKNIYRLEYPHWAEEGYWSTTWARQLPDDLCNDVPEIEKSATIWPTGHYNINSDYSRKSDKGIEYLYFDLCEAEREGLDIFGLEIIEGSLDNFLDHSTLVLKESAARKFNISAGDVICYGREASEENTATVIAICKDPASPGILDECDGWGGMPPQEDDNPNNWNDPYYLMLSDGASPEVVCEKLRNNLIGWLQSLNASEEHIAEYLKRASPRLNPLTELYFSTDVSGSAHATGNKTTTYTLLAIAVLIMVIALINFVNFFFALIPVRIKTINTCKIFGASSFTLRLNFVFETVGLVLVALCGAAVIVGMFMETPLTEHISTSIAFGDNTDVAVAVAAVALVTGIIVSIYPAWYITRFSPAMVMGGFHATAPGRRLRYTLVAVQYTISITLVICSLSIYRQYDYMLTHDMGFNKNNLLVVNHLPGETVFESYDQENGLSYGRRDAFAGSLMKNPEIEDVTFADGAFVQLTRMQWGRAFNDQSIYFQVYPVSWDFLRFMGIDIVDGRDFLSSDERNANGAYIFNEDAAHKLGLKVGDVISGHRSGTEVVGICKDFNFRPMQYNIEPFAFYIFGKYPWRVMNKMYVRTTPGADVAAVREFIAKTIAEYAPDVPADSYDISFFDSELESNYKKESKLASLIILFTVLSILISIIGVFGLVHFETQYRRREIGIRRVHGAAVSSILAMFNGKYLRVLAICSVVAVLLGFVIIKYWTEQFVYQAPFALWVYLLAIALVALITVLTVTACSYKAANDNPVEAINK